MPEISSSGREICSHRQQDPEPGTGSSCSGILCRGRSAARAAGIRSRVPGDLQRVPFPAATGAELGHQSGRKDKQTDKQPQAAGTGRIRATAAGSSAGIRSQVPEISSSGWEICSHRQQDPEPGTGSGCSGIHQLMICIRIRSRVPELAAAGSSAGIREQLQQPGRPGDLQRVPD